MADEQGVDVSTIDKNDLFYNGQIVDLHLTKEEKQAKKEKKKAQRRSEKEQRKKARKNN